ncbi:MAG: hypothetical protein R3F19_20745 [Verrucomicrobiales bacterium]
MTSSKKSLKRALATSLLLAIATVQTFADTIVQTFFVPLPEAQVQSALKNIYSSTGSTMNGVVSIVATQDNTVIYYDQWENGYENDLNNPLSIYNASTNKSGTQIWGDADPSNGYPPELNGSTNTAQVDVITAKDVIALENNVSLPRNPSTPLYDGRDQFGSTRALAVSRAEWATSPGTVLAGAIEVYSVREYGTSFTSPVGEDLKTVSDQMFEYVGMMIMASENGTSVTLPGGGTISLNKGESYHIDDGVRAPIP